MTSAWAAPWSARFGCLPPMAWLRKEERTPRSSSHGLPGVPRCRTPTLECRIFLHPALARRPINNFVSIGYRYSQRGDHHPHAPRVLWQPPASLGRAINMRAISINCAAKQRFWSEANCRKNLHFALGTSRLQPRYFPMNDTGC